MLGPRDADGPSLVVGKIRNMISRGTGRLMEDSRQLYSIWQESRYTPF